MANVFSPTERELQLASWVYVLNLEGIGDRFLDLLESLSEEEEKIPWWGWRRRARVREYQEACVRLYEIFHKYAKSQRV